MLGNLTYVATPASPYRSYVHFSPTNIFLQTSNSHPPLTMFNEGYAISVAELVVDVILFPLAVLVALRHSFGRSSNCLYLASFTTIRIASSAVGILSYENLLLASKGLLSRL